jgi:hypothetical protein
VWLYGDNKTTSTDTHTRGLEDMTTPNINNLRARAMRLGLVVTKTTSEQDARDFGQHLYVLHKDGEDWENMECFSLYGIRAMIADIEDAK